MRRFHPYTRLLSLFSAGLILTAVQARDGRAPVADAEASRLDERTIQIDTIVLDPEARTISFPAVINLGDGVLEVIIATPRGRLHEALLKADISPLKLQALLYTLRLRNGPRQRDAAGRMGDLVDIDLEYTDAAGKVVREPVEHWIRDTRTGGTMKRIGWVFTGSTMRDGRFLAEEEGNICINYSVGSTVFDSPDPESTDDTIHVIDATKTEPGVGGQVRVLITPRKSKS